MKKSKKLILGSLLITLILLGWGQRVVGAKEMRTLEGQVEFTYGKMSFEIHGHSSELRAMNAVKMMLQEDEGVRDLLDYFRYEPRGVVHFFLDEKAKQANGSAGLFPHNLVTLLDFPPLYSGPLTVAHRWVNLLVIHELAHIIHMEQTRGFFRTLETVFGSVIRPGALVPRWISEGVAVWAESRFSRLGRLHSSLHEYQLYRKLRRLKDGEIGRLDHLGEYPFGGFSYWVGGFFMDDLETKRPGFIRCFVEKNSGLLPFFADRAFRACGGRGVRELFGQFRQDFIRNYEQRWGKGMDSKGIALPHEDQISWFTGTALVGTVLYYVFWEEDEPFVGAFDGAGGSFRSWKAPASIEHLSYESLGGGAKTVTVRLSPRTSKEEKREVYRLGKEGFVKVLDQKSPYEFHFPGGKVLFRYGSWRWTIVREKEGKEEKKRELPPGLWVLRPEAHGGKIFFKLANEQSDEASLMELDPSGLEMKRRGFGLSGNTFFAGSCGEKVYLSEVRGEGTTLTTLGPALGQKEEERPRYLLPGSRDEGLIYAHFSPKAVFVLDRQGPRFDLRGCGPYLKEFGEKRRPHPLPSWELTGHPHYKDPSSSKAFPRARHFVPRYRYFSYSSGDGGEGSRKVGVQTALSDPLGRHTVDLNLHYDLSTRDGQGGLIYTFSKDRFFWGLGRERGLDRSLRSSTEISTDWIKAFVGRKWAKGSWLYRPELSIKRGKQEMGDLSFREEEYEFFQELFWKKKRRHQFVNHLDLRSSISYSKYPHLFYDDWTLELGLEFGLNYDRRWRSLFRFGSSHTFVGDEDGIGVDFPKGQTLFHNFFGLGGIDLYGERIDSLGLNLYRRLGTPYAQWGLFPLRWTEVGALAGVDYVKASRVVMDETQDSRAHSLYGGLRARIKLFYSLDTTVYFLRAWDRLGPSTRVDHRIFLEASF
ncbi:MAG: hypothetical protein OXB88_10895 [Bacteriovoracales bacterium]|nr:hypothetical protein [Bacteriovoracales bacterium]